MMFSVLSMSKIDLCVPTEEIAELLEPMPDIRTYELSDFLSLILNR